MADSVSSQPCEKHDLIGCYDCAHPVQQGRTRSQRRDIGPWFIASYTGTRCSACGGAIYQGQQIRGDGREGYLCSECGEVA